jgi:hypothetical protein
VNIQQLRHSLKVKWLLYYRQHRPWLTKLGVWGTYEGQRRPSSSFILAVLSHLEPQLIQMFPFIIALSNEPDKIVAALGLNFNPETELKSLTEPLPVPQINSNGNGNGNGVVLATPVVETNGNGNSLSQQMLPRDKSEVKSSPSSQVSNLPSWVDEACNGVGWQRHMNCDKPNIQP